MITKELKCNNSTGPNKDNFSTLTIKDCCKGDENKPQSQASITRRMCSPHGMHEFQECVKIVT